ncbi:molybdate ABC transporter permease subunit [Synechococcus elongatus]|uniref:Molybdenum transport system permease n=1 Tax=Synechococcus elongatus PCC 11802 TaxID=2283154 RepID=A0AAT9JY83_SYNEL|nr:molybdate ABC transporter permease subunit [Synechococcus elongatus]QFZ92413.1 molybdate ABC transporter permease subunit [Synechococcus elongatus PCC 11802]
MFDLGSPIWVSLNISLSATLVVLGLGTVAAYQMSHYRGKARSLIESCLIAPLIMPPTVVGFILLMLLGKNSAIGRLLAQYDLQIVFTPVGAAIAASIVAFPLMYRSALGAFEQIDGLLLDAARLDGASEVEVFFCIALPAAMPGILAGTVLSFARALGEFGATLMVAGNIPGQTQTMPMAIYFAVEAGQTQEAWFWTVIILCTAYCGVVAVNAWQALR